LVGCLSLKTAKTITKIALATKNSKLFSSTDRETTTMASGKMIILSQPELKEKRKRYETNRLFRTLKIR